MARLFPSTIVLGIALVLLPHTGLAQNIFSPCKTNLHRNATVVVPPSTAAAVGPSDEALAGGSAPDSIAVFAAGGTCVGRAAWDASEGTTIPVAGAGPQIPGGLAAGDSLQFRIYDASRGVVDRALVEFVTCSTVSTKVQPLCRETGAYAKDAIYVASSIGSQSASLQVVGTPGSSGDDAGWRLVGLPTASPLPAGDLRLGAHPPDFNLPDGSMLLSWNDEADSETGPSGVFEDLEATDDLQPGRGYALFLFDESPYALDPGIEIGLADTPDLQGNAPVTVDKLTRSAQWHLLANPFPSGYDLSSLSNLVAHGFQATVQRYDAAERSWVLERQVDARLASWQAFFVERTEIGKGQGATSLTFDPSGRIVSAPFVGSKANEETPQQRARLDLALTVTNASEDTLGRDRAIRVVFDEDATDDWDAFDASKRAPLASTYASLPLRGQSRADSLTDKAVESRPWPTSLQSIPAGVEVEGLEGETATITVNNWALPDSWRVQLIDEKTGRSLQIDSTFAHTFSLSPDSTENAPRFKIQIAPVGVELPVELAAFSATLDGETAQLQWKTASETNNAGFYVERRSVSDTTALGGAGESWTELGFVDGVGTSDQPHTYQFTDADLPFDAERFDYRLRQIDTDGTVHLSEETYVERVQPKQLTLRRPSPNPVRSEASLRYALPRAQQVHLVLYDLLGRRVLTIDQGRKEAGRHHVEVDVSRLSSGIYFYRLNANDASLTRRLTVTH